MIIVSERPFINFFTPYYLSEQDALFGFTLNVLPTSGSVSTEKQLRLIRALWESNITALEMRFVVTPDLNRMIYLLCRIRRPQSVDRRKLQDFYAHAVDDIRQLCKNCGYQLESITSEEMLLRALAPFQIQALAEVRRSEAVQIVQDALAEFEVYVTYPWEWAVKQQIAFFELLVLQRSPGLVSIYLQPTQLSQQEREILSHATSGRIRTVLLESGMQGEAIYKQYQVLTQKLQRPYLQRICLAAPSQESLALLGKEIIHQIERTDISPLFQRPQNAQEWQTALYNLRYLEWVPWGNIRDDVPDTSRLRYLVDSYAASVGFHFPVAPEPVSAREQQIKVLLIFSDPTDQQERRLYLDRDDRIIREAIKLSTYRDRILLTARHAATINDVRRALLSEEFHIVHIAGHGAQHGGLIFANEGGEGGSSRVPMKALAELFQAYSTTLHCVVLNACYSLSQGKLIVPGIPFAIGMEGELGNREAREFSRGFYDALGAGKDIEFAYQEGCRCVNLTVSTPNFEARLFKNA